MFVRKKRQRRGSEIYISAKQFSGVLLCGPLGVGLLVGVCGSVSSCGGCGFLEVGLFLCVCYGFYERVIVGGFAPGYKRDDHWPVLEGALC